MDSTGCLSGGLAYLHGQQIKHKDIKPANILVNNGSVLLMDFGLSTDFSNSGISTSYGPTGLTREVLFALYIVLRYLNSSHL